jgi:hypothetical protein
MIMGEFGMKKCLAVLASLSMLVTAGAPAFAAGHKKSGNLDRTVEQTEVYASDSFKARVIAAIPAEQTVTVLNRCDGMCLVKWKGVKGYVDDCNLEWQANDDFDCDDW